MERNLLVVLIDLHDELHLEMKYATTIDVRLIFMRVILLLKLV